MELNATHRLVRWAYINDRPPARTSLCVLFWRAVLGTPIQIVVLLALSPIWAPWLFYDRCLRKHVEPWINKQRRRAWDRHFAKMDARMERERANGKQPSTWRVLVDGAMAIKAQVCPIITIRPAPESPRAGGAVDPHAPSTGKRSTRERKSS